MGSGKGPERMLRWAIHGKGMVEEYSPGLEGGVQIHEVEEGYA